jgi:hypothetical protein
VEVLALMVPASLLNVKSTALRLQPSQDNMLSGHRPT